MTTPEQARQQLAQAEKIRTTVTGFSPSWIIYVALCAAGPMYVLGNLNATESFSPATIMTLTWVFAFVAQIPVFAKIHPNARRGFGKRWSIMMALWAVAWALAVALPSNVDIAMMMSIVFLGLGIAGPLIEAFANRPNPTPKAA